MEFRADLHCHSNYSDGGLSPKELLLEASKQGLSGLSITDHDTVAAYSKGLFSFADNLNIKLLPGVEISSALDMETIHVLGYGFDYKSKVLNDFLAEVRAKKYIRNKGILERLSRYKMYITEEELGSKKSFCIGRPHIARVMVEKGYVKSFREAFDVYLKDGGRCYVFGEKFSVKEVLDKLHEVGAKAVLAHPHQILKGRVLKKALDLPFDGLEGYYGKLPTSTEKKFIKMAREKNLLITGGSDFHVEGVYSSYLGCSWVGRDVFDSLG